MGQSPNDPVRFELRPRGEIGDHSSSRSSTYPTVDDLPILRDWRVDAGAAFGIDELVGLWHGVWIFAAVIQRLEPKAGAVQMRVLRAFFGGQLCEPMGKFHAVSLLSIRFPQ
jgi:hypothetical protein